MEDFADREEQDLLPANEHKKYILIQRHEDGMIQRLSDHP